MSKLFDSTNQTPRRRSSRQNEDDDSFEFLKPIHTYKHGTNMSTYGPSCANQFKAEVLFDRIFGNRAPVNAYGRQPLKAVPSKGCNQNIQGYLTPSPKKQSFFKANDKERSPLRLFEQEDDEEFLKSLEMNNKRQTLLRSTRVSARRANKEVPSTVTVRKSQLKKTLIATPSQSIIDENDAKFPDVNVEPMDMSIKLIEDSVQPLNTDTCKTMNLSVQFLEGIGLKKGTQENLNVKSLMAEASTPCRSGRKKRLFLPFSPIISSSEENDSPNNRSLRRSLMERSLMRLEMLTPPVVSRRRSARASTASEALAQMNDSLKSLMQKFLSRDEHFQAQLCNLEISDQEKVLLFCEPGKVIPFSSALDKHTLENCVKIGEGSYGEIFRVDDRVLKVVRVQSNDFTPILPEVIVSFAFNELNSRCANFISTTSCVCVKGKFPKPLQRKWNEFARVKGTENDNPAKFKLNQLYLLFTLDHGGECLEDYVFRGASQALGVFRQILCSLAIAETALSFEHRDLHWGNILISPSEQDTVTYELHKKTYSIDTNGLCARIIDFSLSRCSLNELVFYADLAKESELFEGEGDNQFDVYRLMKQHNGNDWRTFSPKTNIFWLEYLLEKLVTCKKYTSRRKIDIHALKTLRQYKSDIGKFESATEALSLIS